jgi:hypothetical protein
METTTTSNRRESARKELHMASIVSTPITLVEREVREFAREFPTPNVQRAVALCESGRLTWTQVHEIFRGSLAQGLSAVA